MAAASSDMATFVVQTGPEAYELRQTPLPDIGEDEALVKVEACGVCGTDFSAYNGALPPGISFPIVPGHEVVGRIARIGSSARQRWNVDVGDRVVVVSVLRCGRCQSCVGTDAGSSAVRCRSSEFASGGIYGFVSPEKEPGLWGGFSTHLFLPPTAIILPMSADVPLGEAALFNALANGVHWAVDAGGAALGKSVVVLGPGPRGLCSVIAARAVGAGPIVVTGLPADRDRLSLALELGADHALEISKESVVEAVTGALGRGPDVVVDTTPQWTGSVIDAIRMAAREATIVLAGHKGPDATAAIPVDEITYKLLTVRGALRNLDATRRAIALIESRQLPLARLASHSFSLDQAAQAVQAVSATNGERPFHVRIEPGI